jgi:hypothetical protein
MKLAETVTCRTLSACQTAGTHTMSDHREESVLPHTVGAVQGSFVPHSLVRTSRNTMSIDPQADDGAELAPPRRPSSKTIICVATVSGAVVGYITKDWELGVTVFSSVISAFSLESDG